MLKENEEQESRDSFQVSPVVKTGVVEIWTLFIAEGHVDRSGVEVQHYEDGTTRINASLHSTDDLVISEKRIESKIAGWYLER